MSQSMSRKRPWLAALLAALATGFGHLYLRRWRRALGWLVALFGVAVLFVEPSALGTLAAGDAVDPITVAPILVVAGLSVVDAYLVAVAHNAVVRLTPDPDGRLTHCPNCGEELDSELEFCHWCTAELNRHDRTPPGRPDDRDA